MDKKLIGIPIVLFALAGIGKSYSSFSQNLTNNNDNKSDTTATEEVKEEVADSIPENALILSNWSPDECTPIFELSDEFYKERYNETDAMYKVVDNWGNGFENLYGTRNLRPILHGVAYRGGANNYFHKEDKRHNSNPLPNDGLSGLCNEGFSASVYLYRTNFEEAPPLVSCDCINGKVNMMEYVQKDYFDDQHVYDMLKMVYESATDPEVGPVYLHCWNGWHASGFISAIILKQFCGYSDFEAMAYWDLGTDGANRSPRYQQIKERIKNFKPYDEFIIKDDQGNRICPEMPKNIDSNLLVLDIEHLVIVPEAIPLNYNFVLHNVQFGPGKTSISSPDANKDLINLHKAMVSNPGLVIEIGGHTDKSGNANTNYSLSVQRAKFVYDYLINKGISADRMRYKGYGQTRPIMSNKYKQGREANRRIEVTVLFKEQHENGLLVDESKVNLSEKVADATADIEEHQLEDLSSLEKGKSIILKSIQFEPYIVEVATPEATELPNLLQILKENPNLNVEVQGHTDDSGDEQENITLSTQRAQSVYQYLIDNGIDKTRLTYKGYGPKKPKYSNAYKWGRDMNRRIEIVVQ